MSSLDQPAPGAEGAEVQGRSLPPRPSVGMGSHLKLLGTELTNQRPSERSENLIDKPGFRLSYLGQGCESTGVHGSWELEPWDCGMIPG